MIRFNDKGEVLGVCPACFSDVPLVVSTDYDDPEYVIGTHDVNPMQRVVCPGAKRGPASLEDVLEAVREHEVDFPTHGTDCTCVDRHIQAVRRLTAVPGASVHTPDAQLDTEHHFRKGGEHAQQRRIDYVLRAAWKGRY